MKHLFLLIFMWVSAGVTAVYAQTNVPDAVAVKSKVSFGVKLGGQLSAIKNIYSGSSTRFPGLTAGVVMRISIPDEETNRFYIVPELLYSQEGEEDRIKENNTYIKYYYDYISLPILMRAYTLDNDLFYIEIGPKVSYLIHQKNELYNARKFDAGLCIGGGINISGEHKFELGVRLDWGLVDIYPDVQGKNSNLGGAITLSYFFGK